MKFLLINASPHENGGTARALLEAKSELEKSGDKATVCWIGKEPRYACLSCGGCKSGRKCVIGDLDGLYPLIRECDGFLFGTPTHYAGATGNLLAVLSRLCFSAKELLLNKPAATVAVARRGGAVNALYEVNKFFGFCSMITVGGCYPPIIYGDNDPEGMQNVRSVSNMLRWIASCIKNGKENGIFPPEEEIRIKANL